MTFFLDGPNIDRNGHVSFRAKLEGHRKNIRVRSGACVREHAWLNCMDEGSSIDIGERTLIMPYAKLVVGFNGSIKIGRLCTIHSFDVLYGFTGGLQIGDNVRTGTNVSMITANHSFDDPNRGARTIREIAAKGIIIHDNVWVGAGVIIRGWS